MKKPEARFATLREEANVEINEYQDKTATTAVYPWPGEPDGFEYTLFGLVGEAGELANKYKKILRNQEYLYDNRKLLMDELGDVLWYVARIASELDYTLEEVAKFNLNKLALRKKQNELKNRKD